MTLLQLHPDREQLVSSDQFIGSILEPGIFVAHGFEDQHFLAEHPQRIGKASGWATDRFPSTEHVFGQGKASLRGHRAHGGAERNIGQ